MQTCCNKRMPNLKLFGVIQAFILIVMLLVWQDFFDLNKSAEYDVLEFFAGVGRIAKLGSKYGYKTGAYDIGYDLPQEGPSTRSSKKRKKLPNMPKASAMDLTSDTGFVLLVLICSNSVL